MSMALLVVALYLLTRGLKESEEGNVLANIYQEIWDADQSGNGLEPLVAGAVGNEQRGFVRLGAASSADADFKVLADVSLPAPKQTTYDLVRALFDNYALSERDPETETPEEREEVHDLLDAVIDTPPMQVARRFIERATGTSVSSQRWYATLLELWFRRFSQGGDPDLSGFEHVFVGEQQQRVVQGYHFWYKYWLDDGLARQIDRNLFPALRDDRIQYLRSEASEGQEVFPHSVTIAYRWDAPDYERKAVRPLVKKKGGFFVGCSVEGLLALGAVRAHLGARAPKEALIGGARYDLKMFRSEDQKNIRTFYPVFLGPVEGGDDGQAGGDSTQPVVTSGSVRIVAALVNPMGDDEGSESVTFVNTGRERVDLNGWRLLDKAKKHYTIGDVRLAPGQAFTQVLPRNTAQLSNKGGEIRLVDGAGSTIHIVSYSKAQASRQGETVVF